MVKNRVYEAVGKIENTYINGKAYIPFKFMNNIYDIDDIVSHQGKLYVRPLSRRELRHLESKTRVEKLDGNPIRLGDPTKVVEIHPSRASDSKISIPRGVKCLCWLSECYCQFQQHRGHFVFCDDPEIFRLCLDKKDINYEGD